MAANVTDIRFVHCSRPTSQTIGAVSSDVESGLGLLDPFIVALQVAQDLSGNTWAYNVAFY